MSDRSWFYALNGQQNGPCPEGELRALIASGTIRPDTLVWTDGMSGWQKAGEASGLFDSAASPQGIQQPGAGALSIEFGIWEWIWRHIVLFIGLLFIIPTPWVVVMYCRWILSCMDVPGRPNLMFSGRAVTLMWYYLLILAIVLVAVIASQSESDIASGVLQILMYWLLIRWFVANIASNEQPLGLTFSGSFWGYLGWNILTVISAITIVGWAWVYTAQVRWICNHVEGTRRRIVFNASGLEMLWRAAVTVVACLFILPIPWAMRWFIRWQASQVELVARANA